MKLNKLLCFTSNGFIWFEEVNLVIFGLVVEDNRILLDHLELMCTTHTLCIEHVLDLKIEDTIIFLTNQTLAAGTRFIYR